MSKRPHKYNVHFERNIQADNLILMAKEMAGHISIVLETIAFFLVTVDLYGKERLLALRNRIQALEIDEVNKKFNHPIKQSNGLNLLIHGLVLTPIFIYVYLSIKYGVFLFANYSKQNIFILVVYVILIVILSVVIFWKLREVLEVFRYFMREIMLFYIVKSLILITKLFPVEGVMITIGAILYITAKIIAYQVIAVQ